MKYLKKLFENIDKKFWLVIYTNLTDGESSHEDIFEDEESAENFYLQIVNDEKRRQFENKKKEFTLNDVIINSQDAKVWIDDNLFDVRIYYYGTYLEDKCELSDEIKMARKAKKYNI